MPRELRPLLATAGVLLLLSTPASATAAEITLDHACYADPGQRVDTIGLSGSGFAPHAPVQLAIDGHPTTTATADASGVLTQPLGVPPLARGTLHHTFLVSAQSGTSVATAALKVSRLFATFKPASGDPNTLKVRFSLYGFALAGRQSPPIYVHYVSPAGKLKKTYRLGSGNGPCGSLRTSRRRLFPFRAGRGAWKLQFDTRSGYRRGTSKSTFLYYTLGVNISGT